ncbi:MAG TPA: hypothetical protein VFA11_16270 [Acidimicrobiales bacterium]|nr:hypothetical protein [Acidimicrobiales bacterium]
MRRRGGPSVQVVLHGGPRDGEELVILGGEDLPPQIPDDLQGGYHLGPDPAQPARDRKGRPIYRWSPGAEPPGRDEGDPQQCA